VPLANQLETALSDESFMDDCFERLRAYPDYSHVSRDDIPAFIAFLRASGGFQVW
jgi:hypothetical protein